MTSTEVLIAGAGPTGLVLALYLAKMGVSVRIVDTAPRPGTTSRALAVQARTLELYAQIGVAEEIVARGCRTPAVNLWFRGEKTAHIAFSEIGSHLSAYPFLLIFPQDQHEQLLSQRLRQQGIEVERSTELIGFQDQKSAVIATLRLPNGSEETCYAAYLAGCDGARSIVRHILGSGFPGGSYSQLFYVADVDASGPAVDGELHVDLDEADFLAVFPLADSNHARLIGTVRDERAQRAQSLTFDDVSERANRQLKVNVAKVNWFSTYHVHHRVTDHFRNGRAFLLGDAAHIHSPAGGQGMNTGIGDAINLAWKLAAVLKGQAGDSLLDSYEAERIGFARRLVATTDRVFSMATAQGAVAEFVRTRLAPLLLPKIVGFEPAREFLFRTVGQLALNYRGCLLSVGDTGKIHGGDRLPWVAATASSADNYASLSDSVWQIHVYGHAQPELLRWSEAHALTLWLYAWTPAHAMAGLQRDAVYLLRPDSYIAVAARPQSIVAALEQYFRACGLALPSAAL